MHRCCLMVGRALLGDYVVTEWNTEQYEIKQQTPRPFAISLRPTDKRFGSVSNCRLLQFAAMSALHGTASVHAAV